MKQVLKFSASWCGPCETLSKVLEDVKKQLFDVDIKEVDVDNNEAEVQKYGIRSVPTMVLLDNGIEVGRIVGVSPKEKILDFINQ